jgi:hypothetical protein
VSLEPIVRSDSKITASLTEKWKQSVEFWKECEIEISAYFGGEKDAHPPTKYSIQYCFSMLVIYVGEKLYLLYIISRLFLCLITLFSSSHLLSLIRASGQ